MTKDNEFDPLNMLTDILGIDLSDIPRNEFVPGHAASVPTELIARHIASLGDECGETVLCNFSRVVTLQCTHDYTLRQFHSNPNIVKILHYLKKQNYDDNYIENMMTQFDATLNTMFNIEAPMIIEVFRRDPNAPAKFPTPIGAKRYAHLSKLMTYSIDDRHNGCFFVFYRIEKAQDENAYTLYADVWHLKSDIRSVFNIVLNKAYMIPASYFSNPLAARQFFNETPFIDDIIEAIIDYLENNIHDPGVRVDCIRKFHSVMVHLSQNSDDVGVNTGFPDGMGGKFLIAITERLTDGKVTGVILVRHALAIEKAPTENPEGETPTHGESSEDECKLDEPSANGNPNDYDDNNIIIRFSTVTKDEFRQATVSDPVVLCNGIISQTRLLHDPAYTEWFYNVCQRITTNIIDAMMNGDALQKVENAAIKSFISHGLLTALDNVRYVECFKEVHTVPGVIAVSAVDSGYPTNAGRAFEITYHLLDK